MICPSTAPAAETGMAFQSDPSLPGFDRREFLRLATGTAAAAGLASFPRALFADPPTRPSLLPALHVGDKSPSRNYMYC